MNVPKLLIAGAVALTAGVATAQPLPVPIPLPTPPPDGTPPPTDGTPPPTDSTAGNSARHRNRRTKARPEQPPNGSTTHTQDVRSDYFCPVRIRDGVVGVGRSVGQNAEC